ncbi:uncharacterized protein PV07_08076 [Cladophialophora immunda]|uniref:Uncharacterized protein n=1 Tax=Cladophialophora immunda TaxID=569365 RepID=A0A0D2CXT1_9EURO|nr:uncharacterized protein PV07_08076 [Cladophialophora immunda]KIW28409.1 hypothetical protein PV07_08076 [Cladophialophora immunda]
MDGLSTIGSIIAIAQAIGAIPSIIKTLDRFVHTKRELAGLLNELYTLQLLRLAVEDTGKLFSAADNPGELAIPEPPLLSRARTSLDKIITELRLLADRLERQSTLHRLKFILCSRKIAQLQADARAIRENLHLALSQMALLSQHAHGKMLLEVHSIISNKDVQSHQALPPQSSLIPSIVESETGHTAGMISDQPPALFQSDSVPNERSEAPAHHTEARPSRDFVRIETSLRLERKCNVSCHCQCHFNRMQLRSPRWLSCALGNFFLSYDCLPVPGRWKCDQAQCSRSSSSLHVSYHLPRWLIDRALSLTASFDGLTGGGATIHFTVPRILGMRNILWKYISMDDVVCVEKLLRETRHRPTDMNEYGHSLLQYAILQRASRVFELMNQTWQLHRFPNRRDRNSMLLIRELVMTSPKRQTDPFILAINRLIDCDEDEVAMQSPVHKAVRADADVLEIINEERNFLATTDDFHWTPLHLACAFGHSRAVQTLIDAGSPLDLQDYRERTPLVVSVHYGQYGSALCLVKNGCNILAVDENGDNACAHILRQDLSEASISVLAECLRREPGLAKVRGWHQRQLLHFLAQHQTVAGPFTEQCLRMLLIAGADPDSLDAFGATPLILAVEKNNVTVVRLLLEAGARLETSDHGYGRRILHFVALYGNLKLINFFRTVTAAGQSMTHDTEDLDGNTPINSWKWRTQSNGRLWPGMRRPTLEETDAFEGLIQDIRNRAVPR